MRANQTSGRPPSISDVARAAGVSVTTVSRVLNTPDAVSERRRTAVHRAMAQLNYRPSSAARSLVTGRSSTIAIVVTDTSKYGYVSVIRGVEESARREGYATIISVIDHDDADHARRAVDLILGQSVAGVIAVEFDRMVARVIRSIPAGVPMAIASTSGAGAADRPTVRIDDAFGMLRATRHLLELGHPTVHYLGLSQNEFPEGRHSGWQNALLAAGIEPPPIIAASWDPDDAYRAVTRRMEPAITALLCQNDELAMASIRALADLGYRVPEDVSVIGMDDHPLARFWRPGLTTVSIDFVDVGRQAFDLLNRQLTTGADPGRVRMEPGFVERQSVAAARRRTAHRAAH